MDGKGRLCGNRPSQKVNLPIDLCRKAERSKGDEVWLPFSPGISNGIVLEIVLPASAKNKILPPTVTPATSAKGSGSGAAGDQVFVSGS